MGLNDTTTIGILGDTISSGKRSHMSSLWETFDAENDVYRLSVPLAWPLGQVGETSAMNVANQLSAYVENSSALGSGSVALFDVVRRTADDQAAQSGELNLDVPYQDAMIPIRFNSGSYITDQSPHVYLGDVVPGESVGGAWEPTFASATAGIDRNYDRWTEGAAPNFASAVLDVEADAFVNMDSITSPTYGAAPGTYRLDWKREVVDEGPWPVPNSNVSCIYPDTEFGGLQSDHNCEITAGDCVSLDYHGYTYNLVQIGNDCWFAEDLQTTVNAAGDTLVLGTDYRYPLDDAELGPSYGMYYTWYAGMESCPTGWHMASDNEWSAAEVAHGMSESDAYSVTGYRGDIGLKMRDGSTLVHGSSSGPSLTYIGTNDLGMSIVPYGGYYTPDVGWYTQSATATAAYYTSTVERDGGNLFIWERWFRNDEDRRKTPSRWLWTTPLDGDEMGKIRCVRDGRTAAQRVKLDGSGPCEGVASYTYDGHAYDLVEIGNDCWFAEDLQTTVNASGDTLVLGTDYRYPLDSAELVSSYAMFYTWDVGMESCPSGWHLASDNEWSAAEIAHGMSEDNAYNGSDYRGVDELVGLKMRDGSTLVNGQTDVDEQIYIGTNDLGLSIVAYGGRYAPGSQHTQANGWYNQVVTSMLWTGTKENGKPRYRWFRNNESGSNGVNPRHGVLRSDGAIWESNWMGKVRCVRDGRTAAQRVKLDGSGPCEGAISYTYDGYAYDLVEIGNDCWFAEDLRTTVSAAGDTLVLDTDYRYPNDDVTLVEQLGHVYTWDAAMEVCPTGWHLASDNEWSAAEVAHGIESDAYSATSWRGQIERIGEKMRDGSSPVYSSQTATEQSFHRHQ